MTELKARTRLCPERGLDHPSSFACSPCYLLGHQNPQPGKVDLTYLTGLASLRQCHPRRFQKLQLVALPSWGAVSTVLWVQEPGSQRKGIIIIIIIIIR